MNNYKYYKLKNQFKEEVLKLPYKLAINLKIIDFKENTFLNGQYKHNEKNIYINKHLLNTKSEKEIFSILMHELTHAIQNYKIDNRDFFKNEKKYIDLLDICINKIEYPIVFCNINNDLCNFHINPSYAIYDKSNLLYILCLSEREAFEIQDKINETNLLKEAYDTFNKIYKTNLSNEEINKLIDNCYLNLYYHENPTGAYQERNIQATIMYDIAHLARYFYLISDKNNKLLDEEIDKEINALLNISIKEKVLAIYGYIIFGRNPINDLYNEMSNMINDIEILNKLTKEQQISNPKLLLRFYQRYGENIYKYIKDKNTFIEQVKELGYFTI